MENRSNPTTPKPGKNSIPTCIMNFPSNPTAKCSEIPKGTFDGILTLRNVVEKYYISFRATFSYCKQSRSAVR